MNKKSFTLMLTAVVLSLLAACSPVKHVPQGQYLLDHADIKVTDNNQIKPLDLMNYLRQTPNYRVLGCLKLQLATYNLSGNDTTKWYNRWFRRLGKPPVIWDSTLTEASARQLQLALTNMGYMDASVKVDTVCNRRKRRMNVTYNITTGEPHYIDRVDYQIPDTAIERIVMSDTARSGIRHGQLFDRNNLDAERTLLTERLRNRGYYSFNKEYITFIADTAQGSKAVDLTLVVNPPAVAGTTEMDSTASHVLHYIRSVKFITDYHPGVPLEAQTQMALDSVTDGGFTVFYGRDRYLKPSALDEKCFLSPGKMYAAFQVDRTYEALSQLGILKSIVIEMRPVATIDGREWLDAYVLLTRNKKQGVTFDIEGTNSEGDLGFGVGLTYTHRDLGRASNQLTAKFRASYESLSGKLDGLINDRYTEFAGEVGIQFPKFEFPFLSRSFKQRVRASTEFAVSFNYQERPEYTRIIAGGAWKYRWNNRNNTIRRTLDLIDINYVYLPESTLDFLDQIAPSNPLLRYSYEDHFIMRIGYTYNRTNRRTAPGSLGKRVRLQPLVYNMRASVETAGNLLYAISSLTGQRRHNGVYRVFGIQYSEYAKAEFDYSIARHFNERHSMAFHVGAGVGVPYGNSEVLPFEKRFYAGGANGVRGWGVRTLGPGSYDARNSVTDFINQCGDIRLDLSAEYRAKLIWIFEGALFVDAGNIWTIKSYENQPGGVFKFDKFWKQIAMSYGIGLRMDFDYFLLRFDLGVKAYNPAENQERWPLLHPRWKRDTTFHFAVGYPF